jgi:hypothetical protein
MCIDYIERQIILIAIFNSEESLNFIENTIEFSLCYYGNLALATYGWIQL